MSSKYRRDIDGLRAVAIAAVVMFHAFPTTLPGGFIGVDIFFVISGYLITGILVRENADGQFSLLRFYERRIRRIFPALIVVLAACLVFGWFALLPLEYGNLGRHALTGVLFASNLKLLGEAGYFAGAAMFKPLLHLWSLGIEEQFYILWPVVLWLGLRLRLSLFWLVVVLGLWSFALNMAGIRIDPIATFYLPQTRAWELLVGAGLAIVTISPPAWLVRLLPKGVVAGNIVSLLGSGLIIYGLATLTESSSFPGWRALLPTLGTAMLIWSEGSFINRHLLSMKAMVWVGLISYPLYLWHWPLLSFARIVESGEVSLDQRVVLVVLAIALAAMTYLFVERPLRYGLIKLFAVPASIAALVAVGFFGYAISIEGSMRDRAHVSQTAAAFAQFVGANWQYVNNPQCVNDYPLEGSEEFGWWFCLANSERPPEILLLGNSLANQIYPGLVSNAAFAGKSILSIGTCELIWVDPEGEIGEEGFNPCSGDRAIRQQELIDGIIAAGTIEYVLVAGLSETPTAPYIEAFRKRMDVVEGHGAKVIVYTPYIIPEYDIRSCFARPFKTPTNDCQLDIADRDALVQAFAPLRESIVSTNPDIRFFDTNELICSDHGCSMIQDDMPMMRDEVIHWSEFASNKAGDMLVEWAEINAPGLVGSPGARVADTRG